jgi:hypothetical protein
MEKGNGKEQWKRAIEKSNGKEQWKRGLNVSV